MKPIIKKKRTFSQCITNFLEKEKRKYDVIRENELKVSMENIITKKIKKKERRRRINRNMNDSEKDGKKNERQEKRKKRKNSLIIFDEDENEDNKEAKRSRTTSEDIRRFFRTEDMH